MGNIHITFSGLSAIIAEIEALKGRIDTATRDATTKSGDRLKIDAILHFHGQHAPGAWHVGGDAPNFVSGYLASTIAAPPSVNTGTARYETQVGPTAIYSRVIEFGYVHLTPKDKQYLSWFDTQYGVRRYRKYVDIPPHPFFTPAFLEMPPQMTRIFHDYWERAWLA